MISMAAQAQGIWSSLTSPTTRLSPVAMSVTEQRPAFLCCASFVTTIFESRKKQADRDNRGLVPRQVRRAPSPMISSAR